ncbi:MAG: hypothetical protein WAM79_04420 [Candidatus Sulfotelmatobacter sp.]
MKSNPDAKSRKPKLETYVVLSGAAFSGEAKNLACTPLASPPWIRTEP